MKPYLFIGIEGTELTHRDKHNLQHPCVAGVILFSRNYTDKKQLTSLCQSIHQCHCEPSLPKLRIATDHEGGKIQRFKKEFTAIPSPASFMQKSQTLEEAKRIIEKYSHIASKELAECGVDINFAPCLDLEWGNSLIMHKRCYDRDPNIVAQLSQVFMRAHHQNGVLSVAKHFPGHGFAAADSHLELPIDWRNYEEISVDIRAFSLALPNIKAIMMAHILFPQVDSYIASFSAYWMQTILRQQLGFNGEIFSDDLQMKATDTIGNAITRVKQALYAGNDYLIWGNELDTLSTLFTDHHDTLINLNSSTLKKRPVH